MKKLLAIGLGLMLAGCGQAYTPKVAKSPTNKLTRGVDAYIILPEMARHGDNIYPASSQQVAASLMKAFDPYLGTVKVGRKYETVDQANASASAMGARYLIAPTIITWEDRISHQFSMKPDKVGIKVVTRDMKTGEIVASAEIGNALLWRPTLNDPRPQIGPEEMLPDTVAPYVKTLF